MKHIKEFKKSTLSHRNKMQKLMSRWNGLIHHPRNVRRRCNRRYESGNVSGDKPAILRGVDP